jgi:Na+/proline symporter/signal transduction histidine kinase
MNFDINAVIFIAFLAGNFIFGLWTSRGVTTLRGYAIGDKNFSTATLVSTIVATCVSGSFFFVIMTETYAHGIIYMSLLIGEFFSLTLIGIYLAPRMGEFLGKLSIAEAMGDLYGKKVRIITSIAGFIGVAGIVAIQLKVAGTLFEYALGVNPTYGIILSGIFITLYSSLGGIKSVTFTDVVQFATFCIIIPVIGYFLFGDIKNNQTIADTLSNNPVFDYKTAFSFSNPAIYSYIALFIWCSIPSFTPPFFQRIAMARNTSQASQSFRIAAFICLFLSAAVCWIGILVLSSHPNLPEEDIFKFIINNSSWWNGFKGIILIGIMAMVMSTVDSYINSSSVIIVHDLRQALSVSFIRDELSATRTGALIIGLLAILFAMQEGSLLDIAIWANMFHMPIVDVPFILAIIGFRSSPRAVLIGMSAGCCTAMIWETAFKIHGIGGTIPGVIANFVFYFSAHYLLKESGGWVGIKDKTSWENANNQRKLKYQRLVSDLKSFNLANTIIKNTPKGDGLIFFVGLYVMISAFANTYSLTKNIQYGYIASFLYPITLSFASGLTSYPLWLPAWREKRIGIAIVWNLIMFVCLVCFGFLMVLISNFAEIQLMVFMVNILVISFFVGWRWALFTLITGVAITTLYYQKYIYVLSNEPAVSQSAIIYLLVMISSTLIAFLKPRQEYIEATEHKVGELEITVDDLEAEVGGLEHENVYLGQEVSNLNVKVTNLDEKVVHYSERVADQAMEIERLGATAQKILNNVNHELRLPVGNVMNFAEMLSSGLGKYTKKQLKELSDEVFKNSNRLSTMILNMLDLAMLDVKKIELNKKTINLSELVEDRVEQCRKIYLQGKNINFELELEPIIMISVDPNYIRQTVDNLVINAITYSKSGTIKVSVLLKGKNMVELIVQDEGIGIPKSQQYDIFTPFKMGIHTESKAEGRGVGLALCKAAIEAHGGDIKVMSEGIGAKFTVLLGVN